MVSPTNMRQARNTVHPKTKKNLDTINKLINDIPIKISLIISDTYHDVKNQMVPILTSYRKIMRYLDFNY